MKKADVVIVGGGPAGSTVATLLKKYFPLTAVTLLEQATFPRHHVGESLLAGSTPVLKEMEVYDKINTAGFPEKLGATYVWGHSGQPWGFEFEEFDGQLRREGVALPKEYFKGWQVTRAQYDEILLNHAAEFGADVIQGARVTEIRTEDAARRGATFIKDGQAHDVHAEIVVDCSGQRAMLGRQFDLREFDDRLNNVAVYGYWKGAKWKFEYAGFPNLTRILVASTPRGWIWYIPVSRDTISVGFVTHRTLAKEIEDVKSTYLSELRGSPEVSDLLATATLVRLSPDQRSDLLIERDWSYTCKRMTGKGWMLVGDAAGFVDPILSSGVLLCHQNGQKAAYTIQSLFGTSDDEMAGRYTEFYEQTYRQMLNAYRQMASFWYANNFSRSGWWWEAWRQICQANQENGLTDRDSFMRLASGYANRTESASLFGSYDIDEARYLSSHLFERVDRTTASDDARMVPEDRPLKLSSEAEVGEGFVFYKGLIRHTPRLVNARTGEHLDLFPSEVLLLDVLRHGCTLGQLKQSRPSGIRRTPEQLVFQLSRTALLERETA